MMSTEYIDSLRSTLLEGLHKEYPNMTKSACEKIVQNIVESHPKELVKQAGLISGVTRLVNNPAVRAGFAQQLGGATAKAAVAMMAGAGLYGLNRIARAADNDIAKHRFENALRTILSSNDSAGQIIKSVPLQRVQSLANTIFSYAPNVAGDVNLLKTLLATYVNSEGIDPSTIRSLQELEMNRQKIGTWKPSDIGFK